MKNTIIPFLLLALTLGSCQYDLDFSGEDIDPRLFVLGLPGSSDTTVVRLYATVPMGDRNSRPLPMDDARVSLVVNGEEIAMDRADESVPSLPEGCFYTLRPVLPGDKVEVLASAGGVESVRAESAVPEPLREKDVVMKAESWVDGSHADTRLRFSARFKDDTDSDDYYAMQVCRRKEYYTYYPIEGRLETERYEYEFLDPTVVRNANVNQELQPFIRPIIVDYNSGINLYPEVKAPMVVFDDKAFEAGAGSQEFICEYEADRIKVSSYMNGVLEYESGYKCSYKVILFSLSPELYRFIKANEILNGSVSILLAATPPSYMYTNIHGGVGVFGGISRTETDWIPNVDIAQNLQ